MSWKKNKKQYFQEWVLNQNFIDIKADEIKFQADDGINSSI